MLEESRAATDHERARATAARGPDVFGRKRAAAWRTAHSLTGVFPLGVFLLGHLWSQLAGLGGHDAYDAARSGVLASRWAEVALVMVPLTFHAVFGLVLAFRFRPNVGAYPRSRGWMYVAQRITGLVVFAFVCWHVTHLWAPQLDGSLGAHQMYPKLEADLSATSSGFPVAAVATMIGVGCAAFHFSNGLWSFVVGAGLVRRPARQALLTAATVVLGVVLFLAGTDALVYFATGARMMPIRNASPTVQGTPR